jgi:hypothetical protein
MAPDRGEDYVKCPRCSVRVYVSDFWRPLIERVREADEHGPRTYVLIGNDRLLHSCTIADVP